MKTTLDGTLEMHARRIQAKLAEVETIPGFTLDIKLRGRTDGDVEMTYSMNTEYEDYGKAVTGNDLTAVIEEFMRRHGWARANQPRLISHVA